MIMGTFLLQESLGKVFEREMHISSLLSVQIITCLGLKFGRIAGGFFRLVSWELQKMM